MGVFENDYQWVLYTKLIFFPLNSFSQPRIKVGGFLWEFSLLFCWRDFSFDFHFLGLLFPPFPPSPLGILPISFSIFLLAQEEEEKNLGGEILTEKNTTFASFHRH